MKLVAFCNPDDVYTATPAKGSLDNQTFWTGIGIRHFLDIARMMQISWEETEMISELTPSNVTHPLIQTVADGNADVFMSWAGVTHSRDVLVLQIYILG